MSVFDEPTTGRPATSGDPNDLGYRRTYGRRGPPRLTRTKPNTAAPTESP